LCDERSVAASLNDAASKGSKLNLSDMCDALLNSLGLLVSRAEIRGMMAKTDPESSGYVTADSVVDLMTAKLKGSENDSENGPKAFGSELIGRAVRDDITDAVKSFLAASNSNFVGKVVCDFSEEKTTTLTGENLPFMNKKQFRKATEMLGCQIDDLDTLLYEFLDLQGNSQASSFDLILYCYDLAWDGDSVEAAKAFQEAFLKTRVSVKEFHRTLVRSDTAKTGFVDSRTFEKVVAKLCGSKLHPDIISDIERYLDPNKEGRIDLRFAAAMAYSSVDEARATMKLRNMLRILRSRNIDYKRELCESLGVSETAGATAEANAEQMTVKTDEFVTEMRNIFRPPMLSSEIYLVAAKHERRGKLNLNFLLEQLETTGAKEADHPVTKGHSEEFSKNLFRKLCKVRASHDKHEQFRAAILQMDPEMVGHISKRDMQRVCDRHLDLTEPEGLLLFENLQFVDGSHKSELDYSLLLLIMLEPINKSPIGSGTSLIHKMMRGSDSVNLRRLLSLLFRNFAAADNRATGLVSFESAQRALVEECAGIDVNVIIDVITGFKDSSSNSILYPELLSFLGCCSLWNMIFRIHHLDLIRQKQGYRFQDFIITYAKKGKQIDLAKLSDQLLSIGMLIPVTGVSTIFNVFSKPGKGLDAATFANAIANANEDGADSASGAGAGGRSRGKALELVPFSAGTSDRIVAEILKEYDERVTRAVAAAFDIYDPTASNLVPAPELERILCSLGFPPSAEDLQTLWMKVCILDSEGKQQLEHNRYMEHVVAHLRSMYSSFHIVSLDKLHALFDSLDINKDGTLNKFEFRHVVNSVSNQLPSTQLTEAEFDSLVAYLDIDGDGAISWEEFKLTFHYMKDPEKMADIPAVIGAAMKKVHLLFLMSLVSSFCSVGFACHSVALFLSARSREILVHV
jgi:Ca2+-binding EF-hand superfamily protein